MDKEKDIVLEKPKDNQQEKNPYLIPMNEEQEETIRRIQNILKPIKIKKQKKKKKQMVRFRRLNWDIEYYHDLINGNGFQITEPAKVSLDGSKEKSLYGPESPLYGTSYED